MKVVAKVRLDLQVVNKGVDYIVEALRIVGHLGRLISSEG